MDSSSAVFCVLQPRTEQANSSKGTTKAPQQGRPPQAQPLPGPGPAGEPGFGHPCLTQNTSPFPMLTGTLSFLTLHSITAS